MTKNTNKLYVVISAFNEGPAIGDTLKEIKKHGYNNIIVVEDGGSDNTFSEASKIEDVIVLQHAINRGKGAGVKTGIEAAKRLDADAVVTMDGDSQHNPEDIKKMIDGLNEGYDVVLGTRLLNAKGMPTGRYITNRMVNILTWVLNGIKVTDSLSGFRAFSRNALNKIDTQTDRFEYDIEVIREIARNKLTFKEVPIEVRYTQWSQNKTGPERLNLKKGIKTLFNVLISSFK